MTPYTNDTTNGAPPSGAPREAHQRADVQSFSDFLMKLEGNQIMKHENLNGLTQIHDEIRMLQKVLRRRERRHKKLLSIATRVAKWIFYSDSRVGGKLTQDLKQRLDRNEILVNKMETLHFHDLPALRKRIDMLEELARSPAVMRYCQTLSEQGIEFKIISVMPIAYSNF